MVSLPMTLGDFYPKFQGYDIVQRQVTRNGTTTRQRYIFLNDKTNWKSCVVYRTVPLSVTLNDPNLNFKGTPLFDVDYYENKTS